MQHNLLIHSPIYEESGCLHILAAINNAANEPGGAYIFLSYYFIFFE